MSPRKRRTHKKSKKTKAERRQKTEEVDTPRCGLCGKTGKLTKTLCCDQWICDDYDQYVMFSYAHNSCSRNHDRYTLCSQHYQEDHAGDWQNCEKCKESQETEMYVYYGTNEYNFEKLKNPPKFKPTRCIKCNEVISLGEDGYTMSGEGYTCTNCFDFNPFA